MLQLENLTARIPFGPLNDPAQCTDWNPPVSQFDYKWLSGSFVPQQRDRAARVTSAIAEAHKEIEKIRAQAASPATVGDRLPNGVVLRTANSLAAERIVRTNAQQQLVRDIIVVRNKLDPTVPPILRDMERASLAADTLKQRVFDKISCLARANADMKAADLMAYKAATIAVVHHVAPIELNRMIQACLDDGSPLSLVTLDVLRMENFARKRDDRAADNARLIALVRVPEFDKAQPLLQEVQDLNKQALLAWAQFKDHSGRVNIMKMSMGLTKEFPAADPNNPYADLG